MKINFEKNVSKSKWGPILWNLFHTISINNNKKIFENKKHCYYIFYTTFTYIIPCIVCSDHYSTIINDICILEEDKITTNYLKKWGFNVHNCVNKKLGKHEYSYVKFKNSNIIIENENIFIVIKAIYKNFNYDIMSYYKYDQIYNFFINFCILYPDIEIRKKLKALIKEKQFKTILSPKEFKKWFFDNLMNMQNIFCNNERNLGERNLGERNLGFLSNLLLK
jgi:hypothetical protein